MGNFIIDSSFQLIRTNPLLTTNLQIVIDSNYGLYLESINSHKHLNNDVYKHFLMTKYTYLEDKIPQFYNQLPINIAFYVEDNNDTDIVHTDYSQQFDTLYWSGVAKIKDNEFYTEEYEYFAPLYINKDDIPGGFLILRVDDPAIYEIGQNDYVISNTNKNNFRSEIIDKWKCVNFFDMQYNTDFGYWINKNYTQNDRFPKAPFEFDSKEYNYSKWYGIDYFSGVYTNKSLYLDDKLKYENPHFKFEDFITNGYKNNEIIFPNIANFKFLFDDSPGSPFEFYKYSINRYFGFYVDLELVKSLTPYKSNDLIQNLKIENNIFMSTNQITGSTLPFENWDSTKNYYVYAHNNLYKVERSIENNEHFYKIISELDLNINDINRNYEIDIIFNDLENGDYNNQIKSRTSLSLYIDRIITENDVKELYADLYLIKINDKYHVIETKINEYDNLQEHYIRTDYAISCDENILKYWVGDRNDYIQLDVEDKINNSTPITFPIYRVKFRDIKDFDFDRVDSAYADFDCYKKSEYNDTTEHKLYAVEHRDSSIDTVFKRYDNIHQYSDKIINVSSEYVSSDELYEIDKYGLSNIWRKNACITKWGYKNSISHSDYPYKLNNSNKVGSTFNRTTDVFNRQCDAISKTHDYFYRIGDFYSSTDTQNINWYSEHFDNQTLTIETSILKTDYFDLDQYIIGDLDYFDYFFKNNQYINEENYVQTAHYSIFNHGDQFMPSNTLFKGIKFNAYKLSNIIRDDENFINQYITNKFENYNGYKFSIILNSHYTNLSSVTFNSDAIQSDAVMSNIVEFDGNAIHIFINDKFKNILVIINMNFESLDNRYLTFNDTTFFDYREGICYNITKSGDTAFVYDPSLLLASNFINSINNTNLKNGFDDYIKYYYIDSNNDFGYTKINIGNSGSTLRNISSWQKDFPPMILNCSTPEELKTKKNSFTVAAIKGPKYNIYDKYKTDFNELIYDTSFIKEPLARYIVINEADISTNRVVNGEPLIYDKIFYRFNGQYEPIFKTIDLFSPIQYNIINDGFFNQTKCGGYFNETAQDNITIVNYQLAESNLKSDISKAQYRLVYLDDRIITVTENYNNSLNENDNLVTSKILQEKLYLENLKTLTQNSITSYNNSLLTLTQNFYTLSTNINETNWNFRERSLGLCDNNYSYCYLDMNNVITKNTDVLEINNFNFNLPLDSTINGISVNVKKHAQINNTLISTIADNEIKIKKPDGTLSSNKANLPIDDDILNVLNINSYWLNSTTNIMYGNNTDLWNLSITPQELNNNNFSVYIKATAYKNEPLKP
ncbi:hypothetical protein M0Q97_08770, partial [Candidatus Dojkabacteria bacterium]|nr:hypothetical protein [Candidatus Dojkabacteria bacterium]